MPKHWVFFFFSSFHCLQCWTSSEPYLICVVKAVIHEPSDERRFPHCKDRGQKRTFNSVQEAHKHQVTLQLVKPQNREMLCFNLTV